MKLRDEDIESVNNIEEDEHTADEARKSINPLPITIVIAIILLSSSLVYKYYNTKHNKLADNKKENKVEQQVIVDEETVDSVTPVEEQPIEEAPIEENITTEYEIDYSGVESFYNHILENRSQYASFAESFQSIDDVKNLVDFISMFNEIYLNSGVTSSINSQDEFDQIISDYYSSCVRYSVKPQMSLIYPQDSKAKTYLRESEELADNLKNGSGNDYTIANEYYTWLGVNLCDGRTNIGRNQLNAPLIETIRWQYEQYRNVGNMLNARKYQKNDSLPIPGIDVYYSESNYYNDNLYLEDSEYPVTYSETQNSFTCPDWGIDNVVSPTEEVTETRLVIEEEGEKLFKQVDEAFYRVIKKGKTR